MHVRSLESVRSRAVPSWPLAPAEPRVAVLLNANARKMTPQVVRSLSHVVKEDDLFLSRSELDCRRIVQTVLQRGYTVAFLGGGDGTFQGFVNEFFRQRDQRQKMGLATVLPRFGILRLGTGNSLASLVQASPVRGERILDDVLRARTNPNLDKRTLDLLSVEGIRSPFAGVGLDAQVLNDYVAVKNQFGQGWLKPLLSGPGGYFSSVVFRTLPHAFLKSLWFDCEVVNGHQGPAHRLGLHGELVGAPIAPGETLYRGKLMMAAAATVPFYGYEFKMFPFAGMRRGMMQLRLGALSPVTVLTRLGKLWKGTADIAGIHDFYAREVKIRFSKPMPLQIGGDAEGTRDEVTFGMSPESVDVIDFRGAQAV